ncbi:MAG: hypothetical protein JXR56_09055 [Candidatus Cloacimonetes bacterium]|nr:hypothetical protein [Candidatus Cloacimonadota bacterium]
MKRLVLSVIALLICYFSLAQESSHTFRTGDQSLCFMPTAYTMPELNVSLTSYGLLVYQLEGTIIDRTQIGFATVFPYMPEIVKETGTFGIKQNYYRRDNFESAAFAIYTPSIKFATFGNVISYSSDKFSTHLAGGCIFLKDLVIEGDDVLNDSENENFIFMLGVLYDYSESFALYAEAITLHLNADDFDLTAVINGGIRARSQHFSIDLCFLCPYSNDEDIQGFASFPFLKGSFRF